PISRTDRPLMPPADNASIRARVRPVGPFRRYSRRSSSAWRALNWRSYAQQSTQPMLPAVPRVADNGRAMTTADHPKTLSVPASLDPTDGPPTLDALRLAVRTTG